MTSPQHKILLVEDDDNLMEMMQLAFEGEGYHLEIARGGFEAVEKAIAFKPDLILMDVVMPDINGYEAARSIKNCEATKNIPIFFLTAKSMEDDIEEGKKSGGEMYLVKPFSPFELMQVIHHFFVSAHKPGTGSKSAGFP